MLHFNQIYKKIFCIEDSYEYFFVKAAISSLGKMFVAGNLRQPNKPLANLTQFITGALEYTNIYCAVFTGDLNVDVINIFNMTLCKLDHLASIYLT